MKRKTKTQWIIIDWASNLMFKGREFETFDDAEEFLCEYFDKHKLDYEEERGEYEVIPLNVVSEVFGRQVILK